MPNPKKLLDALYGVPMQDGGNPLDRFAGKMPRRGASSLPGYGEGADDPAAQALLNVRRNLGEIPRAIVGAKPYEETNPTGSYRAVQALMNAPTPAAIIPEAAQAAGKAATALSGLGALGVVKPKGGNWLAGTVERGLKPMKQKFAGDTIDPSNLIPVPNRPPEYPGMMYRSEDGGGIIVNPEQVSRLRALGEINNWIDTKLTKYIKNEMATPEDPVRALAERGVLHRAPYELADPNSAIMNKRLSSGMPVKPMGQSQEAQFWENVTDRAIDPARAADFKYGSLDESILQNNPWLEKVPDEAMVYSAKGLSNDLGFNHLIDELRNATNPDSGLPRSLQLSPDKLQKVTVPQAVELVDKINKWRAEQKVAADLKRSQNAATVEYKAYDTIPGTTEPNQRGLRWVELRTPEITSSDQLTPEAQARYKTYLSTGVSEEAALKQAAKYDNSLAESLKYEGETMGHCVGGYCPDVEEGRSRIYSLRDKKGEPHVTIEVQHGEMRGGQSVEDYLNQSPQITQIKGKANRAPKDEYLPFVQDFVRSGQWSSVGDLKNTGLIRKSDYIDTFTPEMLDSVGAGEYMTKQEFNQLADKLGGINKMATGGAVNMQNNRKVRISDSPDTMLLELLRKKHA